MFNSIEEAIEDIKKGKPIIIVDDEDRENEGDLVIPAQVITEETVNFMIKEARGLMCVPITKERADELELNLMTANNTDSHGTAFTISVDSLEGTTTGISVGDRYRTIKDILNPQKKSKDFKKPGHLFPLIASKGGVLDRKGHTEASVDLAKICGYEPVSVIIEIIKDDGEMARRDDLMGFAKKYDLKIITIDHIIDYRKKNEDLVTREVEVVLPTKFGDFKMAAFSDEIEKMEFWNKKNVLGSDMETASLFVIGKLRGVKVGSVLNNVVLYSKDVKDGVNDYVNQKDLAQQGEDREILLALESLHEISRDGSF